MTWSEFKIAVEELGVRDDMTVQYIDVFYPERDNLEVMVVSSGEFSVVGG